MQFRLPARLRFTDGGNDHVSYRCGIYGLMFHTVFAKDMADALNKYEGMKIDLQKFVDLDLNEAEFCHSFTDKW